MKRLSLFALSLVLTACQTTASAEKDKAPEVDLAALKAACTGPEGGYASCALWAEAMLREDATEEELQTALEEVEPFCTEDEPDACTTAHALRYRAEQPRDDGAWSPAEESEWQYAPRQMVQSPQVAQVKQALLDKTWAAPIKKRGIVAVMVSVKEDGEIRGVEVQEGPDPLLERLAMQAALDGRYLPGRTQDGAFRDGVVRVQFDFSEPAPADDAPAPLDDEAKPESAMSDGEKGAEPEAKPNAKDVKAEDDVEADAGDKAKAKAGDAAEVAGDAEDAKTGTTADESEKKSEDEDELKKDEGP